MAAHVVLTQKRSKLSRQFKRFRRSVIVWKLGVYFSQVIFDLVEFFYSQHAHDSKRSVKFQKGFTLGNILTGVFLLHV